MGTIRSCIHYDLYLCDLLRNTIIMRWLQWKSLCTADRTGGIVWIFYIQLEKSIVNYVATSFLLRKIKNIYLKCAFFHRHAVSIFIVRVILNFKILELSASTGQCLCDSRSITRTASSEWATVRLERKRETGNQMLYKFQPTSGTTSVAQNVRRCALLAHPSVSVIGFYNVAIIYKHNLCSLFLILFRFRFFSIK